MPADRIPAKTIIFIAVVFLVLVVVHLRWSADEDDQVEPEDGGPRLTSIQIAEGDRLIEVDTATLQAAGDVQELAESAVRSLVDGAANERRVAAIQLAYMTNDPDAQQRLPRLSEELSGVVRLALLKGLKDDDPAVAGSCAEALIGWWRISKSPAATRHFQRGLAAYDGRQMDAALDTFEAVENLGAPVPPDLYRMKAEVHLARARPTEALAECREATRLEPRHFAAYYAEARAYAAQGEFHQARAALSKALAVYPRFPQANDLLATLSSGPAGGT